MPRSPRADLRPEILLRDNSEDEPILAGLRKRGLWAKIYSSEDHPTDTFVVLYRLLDRLVRQARGNKEPNEAHLDEGLMLFMMHRCQRADTRQLRNSEGEPLKKEGKLVHRLVSVGSRCRMTQSKIARERGCSRSHVNQQIALLRKYGIIVNSGHGWYEFSAYLCWCGKFELRNAYLKVQPQGEAVVLTIPPDDVPETSTVTRLRRNSAKGLEVRTA